MAFDGEITRESMQALRAETERLLEKLENEKEKPTTDKKAV
jgi:hypothetical protein